MGNIEVPSYMQAPRADFETMKMQAGELALMRAAFLARPSVMLGVIPKKDGNAWGAILGDLPTGVSGFGETPDDAMAEFDRKWFGEGEADVRG